MNNIIYEREEAEKKLLLMLQEAEEVANENNLWMNFDELKASVGTQVIK